MARSAPEIAAPYWGLPLGRGFCLGIGLPVWSPLPCQGADKRLGNFKLWTTEGIEVAATLRFWG